MLSGRSCGDVKAKIDALRRANGSRPPVKCFTRANREGPESL
jgi:hypothetical protein